ncbi:MAG: RHS repeat protein, partial [Clostridiales bacterium]|nr:RHS repeat protein [Clostridiales bacterium]
MYSQQQDWLPSAEQYTAAYETIGNNGEIIFHEDSNAETEYTYNSNGDVTREEDDTSVTTYTYGDSNNESLVTEEITTENNEITDHVTYSYDEDGNTLSEEDLIEDSLIETTYIDGNADTETETEEGVITSETEYDYDEEGNVIEEETESGVVEESVISEYDSMGRVISEDDGDTVTTYTYDYMGRVTHSETTTRGISGTTSTSKEYNDNGTLVSETDERGAVTTFTYDSMNRCLSSTKEGNATSHTYGYSTNVSVNTGAVNTSYDILSREITTDTFGHTVSDVYTDSAGKVVKKTESGVTHEYLYDKSGNQVVERLSASGEDPQINMTLYDRNGRSTHEIINPEVSGNSFVITSDSIATESVYSDRDEVIETINAMGDSMYYTYDDAGRTTGIGLTSSANDRTVQYSADGLTTIITDAGGKTQTEVKDESGLTLSMTDSANGCSPITETYSYDSDGNMTKKVMSDGSEIWYEYDALGRNTLEQRFEKIGSALHQTSEVCYTFNIHGDLTKTECYSFSGVTRTLYYKDEFTYDNLGRKVSETVTNGNAAAQTTTWTYDAKGRVTDIDYPAIADISSVTYEY